MRNLVVVVVVSLGVLAYQVLRDAGGEVGQRSGELWSVMSDRTAGSVPGNCFRHLVPSSLRLVHVFVLA